MLSKLKTAAECNLIVWINKSLTCQNVVQSPEAFELAVGADVKSPHGSPESIGDIRFISLLLVFGIELMDEDAITGIDGAGVDRLRSPSKSSMLFETEGALTGFVPPALCKKVLLNASEGLS